MKVISLSDKFIASLLAVVLFALFCFEYAVLPSHATVETLPGESSDSIPGNLIKNPEFEYADWGSDTYYKWSQNNSSFSLDSGKKFAGSSSLKVSNRTQFWSRAQYSEWFGNLEFGKEYYLQGAVSASG